MQSLLSTNEVTFEGWLGTTDPPSALSQGEPAQNGSEGGGRVVKPMLQELGELDRRDDRNPTGARRKGVPCLCRLAESAETAKQVRPIHRDSVRGPRSIERRGSGCSKDRGPLRRPAKVCRATR